MRAVTGIVFPGQESSSASLRKGSDNRHVAGDSLWQGAGVGGGMASATAAVRNDVPCANISAAAVLFPQMGVAVQQWQGQW